MSSIESKRGEKWLAIDSFAWFPSGEELLISEQETNARIGGAELVKSQLLRATLVDRKFTVATTGELEAHKLVFLLGATARKPDRIVKDEACHR